MAWLSCRRTAPSCFRTTLVSWPLLLPLLGDPLRKLAWVVEVMFLRPSWTEVRVDEAPLLLRLSRHYGSGLLADLFFFSCLESIEPCDQALMRTCASVLPPTFIPLSTRTCLASVPLNFGFSVSPPVLPPINWPGDGTVGPASATMSLLCVR